MTEKCKVCRGIGHRTAVDATGRGAFNETCIYCNGTGIAARATPAEQEPVAWIRKDHLQNAKQAPAMCRVEPEFREGFNLVPIYLAPQPTADHIGGVRPEDIAEAREILDDLVSNIETDGHYSVEATCTFLRQALLCLNTTESDHIGGITDMVDAQGVRGAWISVDDRLPEIIEMYPGSGTGSSEPVLVYLADENDNGEEIALWRCFRGGQGDTTTIHWDWNSPKVTHWQPLPAPPQKPVSEVK